VTGKNRRTAGRDAGEPTRRPESGPAAGPLWSRTGTDAAKATALAFLDGTRIMLAPGTSPADGLQAARELLGDDAEFSHLHGGYPVYTAGDSPGRDAAHSP